MESVLALCLLLCSPAEPQEAQYERLEIKETIDSAGARTMRVRALLRFNNDPATESFAAVSVPDVETTQIRFASIKVVTETTAREISPAELGPWTIGPEGMRRYPVPGLRRNDRLEYDVWLEIPATPAAKLWFSAAPAVDLPVVRGTWEVSAASSYRAAIRASSGHSKTTQGADVWKLDGLTPAKLEPRQPWITFSSFKGWQELGAWLSSAISAAAPLPPAVQTEAERVAGGIGDPKARARALYDYVARSIRIADTSFRRARFVPQPPERTLLLHQGDSLARHALLAAMLAAVGLEGAPALVTRGTADPSLDLPAPDAFDRILTVVKAGGEITWVDLSIPEAPFGVLPRELSGRYALLANERPAAIVKVPGAISSPNEIRASWTGRIDENGTLTARARLQVRGDVEVEFRKQIANPSADPDDILLSPPLARAVAAQPPPLQGENPTVVEIELEQRNFVEILIRRSAIHLRAARLAAVKRQGGPVLANIGTTGIIAEEFELKLPSGFRAVLVPGPVHEEVPGGTYESHASYEGGTLRGTRTLVLNEPGVSAGDSRNFAVRIYRDTVRPFTIEQTNTIDVAALVANRNVEDLHQQAYQAIQDGKTQLAYALLREVVARNPAHEYGWNNLGRVLARMGKRREAAEAYRRQIEINPRERWAWSNLGMLQQSTGQHEDAVTSYRKQLEAVPRDQYATTNLGQLLLELGRGAEAEPYIRTAISMNPRNPMLHTLLGAARACQGDAAGAHAGFDAALKLSPSPSVKNNIAWLLAGCNSDLEYALGLANEAEQETQRTLESVLLTTGDWKMAITGQSFLAALYDTKAWVLYRLGRLEESEALLAEACRLSPRWEAFSHLREVRTKIGKSAGAAEAGAAAEVSRAAIRGQSPTSGQPGSADIDDEGWIPLHVPAGALRSPQSLPVDGTGAVFACIVDSSGVIVDALELEGPDAWMNKSPAEFGKLRLPASSPGHSRRRVHLVRIEWTPDGNARAKWSSSDVAIAQALLLAPEIRPEEQAVQPPSNPVEQ